MTAVVFEDWEGRRGHISEGLEVDYQGPWVDVVRTCVERVDGDDPPRRDRTLAEDVYGGLILELTEMAPIVRASRIDDRRAAGPADSGTVETESKAWSPAGSG